MAYSLPLCCVVLLFAGPLHHHLSDAASLRQVLQNTTRASLSADMLTTPANPPSFFHNNSRPELLLLTTTPNPPPFFPNNSRLILTATTPASANMYTTPANPPPFFPDNSGPGLMKATTPFPGRLPPGVVDSKLSFDPEVNHKLTIEKQDNVIALGQSLSLGITNALVRPLVLVNNHLSQAASALPALMAANGAALGTAIATPIQFGTLAANNLAAGITGTLVSIPISVISGGTAQVVGAVESGHQLYQSQVAALKQAVQAALPIVARPVALVGGAHSMVSGIALNLVGTGAQHLATGVQSVGAHLASTGQNIANVGTNLVNWANETALSNEAPNSRLVFLVTATEAPEPAATKVNFTSTEATMTSEQPKNQEQPTAQAVESSDPLPSTEQTPTPLLVATNLLPLEEVTTISSI